MVLDPFMGVGSTGIAAFNLKRNFIGIELNKEYFNATNKRFTEHEQKHKKKLLATSNHII